MNTKLVIGCVLSLVFLPATILMADEYGDLLQSAKTAILERDYDLAIARCNRAISHYPKLPAAYITRAWAFTGKRIYDRSIEDCNTALTLKPVAQEESLAYTNRAGARMNKGDYEEAINDCHKAIKVDPNNYVPYSNLALI